MDELAKQTEVLTKYAPIAISLVSLFVALFVAARNWRYSETSVRYTSRNQYMNALFDIDRQLLARPELWAIYDDHALAESRSTDPLEVARRQAFILYHLNLFETVFNDYAKVLKLTRNDRKYWESWQHYMYYFFFNCSEARSVFRSGMIEKIYMGDFSDFVKDIIADTEQDRASGDSLLDRSNQWISRRPAATRRIRLPGRALFDPARYLRTRMAKQRAFLSGTAGSSGVAPQAQASTSGGRTGIEPPAS